jgi:hypothetical protein
MKLKREFILSQVEKDRINRLDNMFTEGEHDYLNGKRLPNKIKEKIDVLYFKHLSKVEVNGWGRRLLDAELEDLRKDHICKGNTNKRHWVKAYMLNWILWLPIEPDLEFFKDALDRQETYRALIQNAYE